MGCDIHTSMQVRCNNVWHDAQDWQNEGGYVQVLGGYKTELLKERNYALFGILAGVRGDAPYPLAASRGLPSELSDKAREFHEDNHSATYFTLAEVLAYDWTQLLARSGFVGPCEWARWRDYDKPNCWCGSVGGGSIRHFNKDEFELAWQTLRIERGYPVVRTASEHLKGSPENDVNVARFVEILGGGSPYTYVEWQEPYFDAAGELFARAVPLALQLGVPENVRFVVSFDS